MKPTIEPGNVERRSFTARELRIAPAEGAPGVISGHAALFDSLSEDMGGWFERIAPGAFAASILEDDVRCLRDHEECMVLGRNRAGTLKLAEDDRGLAIECPLPDTSYARDLAVSLARGDISQMSFGFSVMSPNDEVWENIGGKTVRTLLRVKLYDVSPVTYPTYASTDVQIAQRSLERFRQEQAAPPPPAPTGRSTSLLARELDLVAL